MTMKSTDFFQKLIEGTEKETIRYTTIAELGRGLGVEHNQKVTHYLSTLQKKGLLYWDRIAKEIRLNRQSTDSSASIEEMQKYNDFLVDENERLQKECLSLERVIHNVKIAVSPSYRNFHHHRNGDVEEITADEREEKGSNSTPLDHQALRWESLKEVEVYKEVERNNIYSEFNIMVPKKYADAWRDLLDNNKTP